MARLLRQSVFTLKNLAQARSIQTSASLKRIYEGGILETIGDTPVVRVHNMLSETAQAKGIKLYAKCEFFNPLSSVKDRLAFAIINDAERKGTLKPGDTVVEATSGNTGIAMAMVCAQKGYNCIICMAESFSIERRKIMRALGAKVVITPAPLRGTGMVNKARELSETHGYFLSRQFENEANPEFHAQTTGPEILSDFAQQNLDYLVLGWGTGGTVAGTGKMVKLARPSVKIVLSEPTNAALVSSGEAQERDPKTRAPTKTHPSWNPHPIQGWTPDFIPSILGDALADKVVDKVLPISGDEAIATSLRLSSTEGIFTGISGGASMATALKVCDDAEPGSTVVAILADTAERYISTPLFASIEADMNEDEMAISKSTPGYQLDPK
eukprot:m.18297 g.18297  ORF g.18297 m.18297 type:complete len:384 (+) comp6274_c0_seq1:73-1224(+)